MWSEITEGRVKVEENFSGWRWIKMLKMQVDEEENVGDGEMDVEEKATVEEKGGGVEVEEKANND